MNHLTRLSHAALLILTCCHLVRAEEDVLVVHVSDPGGRNIFRVVLSTTGDSSTSPPTDIAGKTRIRLAPQTRAGSEITLQIIKAPQDLVFISPWNQRVTVRSFDNESQNVAQVVLCERGSRMLLEYP